jgi:hypothetical protein
LCLWPPAVELTFPLNAAEHPELSFAAMAGNQLVFQDGIQLPCSVFEAALGRYAQLLPKVLADPNCQFQRQLVENRPWFNWVEFTILILEPQGLWCRLHIICTHYIQLSWRDIQVGRLVRCTSRKSCPVK